METNDSYWVVQTKDYSEGWVDGPKFWDDKDGAERAYKRLKVYNDLDPTGTHRVVKRPNSTGD